MNTTTEQTITVETIVNAPVQKVWQVWSSPEHIVKWNTPSEDWHTPKAENDLRAGGKFSSRMEAKDGSFGFDFHGVYDDVAEHKSIKYTIADGRKVAISFEGNGDTTRVTETFDPEKINSIEMQQAGWQAILDNFKKYVESISK
jgi:uncharacterized protein YndB with AHSA1/START domain